MADQTWTHIFLLLVGILACLPHVASSMNIDIVTVAYNGVIPSAINVTCRPEQTDTTCAKKVVAITIFRNNATLATLRKNSNEVLFDRLLSNNIKAEGHIDDNVSKSVVTLTLGNVLQEDNGLYACTMLYFDTSGNLHRDTASKNFTMQTRNVHDVVRYLMVEMSALKKQIERLENNTCQGKQKDKEAVSASASATASASASAFMAGFKDGEMVHVGHVMKFHLVQLNVGNDYNPGTSTFTSPIRGLYAFQVFVRTRHRGKGINVEIVVNTKVTSRLATNTVTYMQSAVSSVVELKAGDKVKCVVSWSSSASQVINFPSSAFSGYLVRPL